MQSTEALAAPRNSTCRQQEQDRRERCTDGSAAVDVDQVCHETEVKNGTIVVIWQLDLDRICSIASLLTLGEMWSKKRFEYWRDGGKSGRAHSHLSRALFVRWTDHKNHVAVRCDGLDVLVDHGQWEVVELRVAVMEKKQLRKLRDGTPSNSKHR